MQTEPALRNIGHVTERSVVIADDNDSVRLLIRLVLEEAGYDIVGEAGTGADAVAAALTHRPDIIVLDEDMPAMNGSLAACLIRCADPRVKIVMCSGSSGTAPDEADALVSKLDVSHLPLMLDRLRG